VKVWCRSGHLSICEKKRFAQKFTDGRTDDVRLAIVLPHSWNELIIKPEEFWMNYFAKTVYSIATISTKTRPLAVYRRFSQAKSEGPQWVLLKSGGHALCPPSPVPPPLQ